MTLFIEVLLNSVWQAAAVAFIVWAVLRWMPRVNAATRYAVWWAVLVLVLLLPLGRLARVLSQRQLARTTNFAVEIASPEPEIQAAFVGPHLPDRLPRWPVQLPPGRWPFELAAVWALVSILQFTRLFVSYVYLRRMKWRASLAPAALVESFDLLLAKCRVRRPVRLLLSKEAGSPIAAGFVWPAVILPESLPEQLSSAELDHVLLHEIAHIARRDDWVNLLSRCAHAVLCLHPVANWILRRISHEREIACDDWVVAATGAPRPYAQSLARLFEICTLRRRVLLATGIAGAGGSQLGDRIAVLLRRHRDFTTRVSLLRVAFAAAILLAMVIASVRTPALVVLAHPSDGPVTAAEAAPAINEPDASEPQASPNSLLAALVAAGYGALSIDDIVELKEHGVSAKYLTAITHAGWAKLSSKQIVSLKDQGVEPDYPRQIHALGIGPYTPDQIVEMKQHGVSVEFFRALKEYGLAQSSAGEIRDAWNQGVRPQTLREARAYGNALTLKQITRLKQAGVI